MYRKKKKKKINITGIENYFIKKSEFIFITKKLKNAKIPYSDAKVYAMPNIYQIYLFDPNANVIEINQNV